jgi:hypothetical protein
VPRARDPLSDAARREGLEVAEVRVVAVEAGIDERYVDHALAEHGLSATGRALRPALPRRGRLASGLRWLGALLAGAPLDIDEERAVAGVLAPREIDRVLNVLRDGTATLGAVAERVGELRWDGAWPGHRLAVSIVPRDAATTIRLSQSIRRAALARTVAALALVGGVAGPGVWILLDVLLHVPAPEWGVHLARHTIDALAASGGMLTALASIPLGRNLVRRLRRFHAARLRTLADLLAVRVREGARPADE